MTITVLSSSLIGEVFRFRASASDVAGTIGRISKMRQSREDDGLVHTFCFFDCSVDPNGRQEYSGWYDCDETDIETTEA